MSALFDNLARSFRAPPSTLLPRYLACRQRSLALVAGLSDADLTVQSMDDASPGKWHLGHTTWFFEHFVLAPQVPGYAPFDARYGFLFNSYYETVGARHPRPRRGLLTRPALSTVLAYREAVDAAMARLLERSLPETLAELVEVGIQHEQQHQELMLTDLLHLFAQNPLRPTYRPRPHSVDARVIAAPRTHWVPFPGVEYFIGHDGEGFGFDCERPRHAMLLRPFALAARPVNNREWLQFIADGGYANPLLWLADGWQHAQREAWCAPMHWRCQDGAWLQMTLAGELPVELDAPVCHISFYEADAFARWSGRRLPTESEWEVAARAQPVAGHFADSDHLRPRPLHADGQWPLAQLYGDVWEWTASPFVAYPGFRAAPGAIGEYNGKFMSGQMVLRGGSCATPQGHVRASYRNFFHPHQRWQFSGLRLAKDRP